MEHLPLDILRKGRGEALDVELLGLQAHGLHKDLVALLLRKADDLGLKAGAVPGTHALDGAVIEGGAVQILPDDPLRLLRGPGEPADGLVLRGRFGPVGEGQGPLVPLLPLHLMEVHRPGVDPGRRAGLEAPQGKAQAEQTLRQAVGGVESVRAGGLHAVPHDGPAGEVGAGGQDHSLHVIDRSGGQNHLGNGAILHPEVRHLALADVEAGLALQGVLHVLLVAAAVRLGPEGPDSGALAPVQKAVLDTARVRGLPHLAPQGVQLPDQMPLPGAADGGVAGHVAHGIQVDGKDRRLAAQARGGQGRLDPGVARADNGHVIASGVEFSHVALSFSSVMTATCGRLKSRRAQRGELPSPRETKTSDAGWPPSVQE